MATKNITTKAVQTKVANGMESAVKNALAIYQNPDMLIEREVSGSYILINVYDKRNHFFTGSCLESLQETVQQYSSKYDNVWYDIEVKPLSYIGYDNEIHWLHTPAFIVHIGSEPISI